MVRAMQSATLRATAQPAIPRAERGEDGVVADIQAGDAGGAAAADAEAGPEAPIGPKIRIGIADTCGEGRICGIPYPTLEQVEHSRAIQRLQWLRHLPAPRTAAEHCIYRRIRAAGWSAPA